MNVNLFNLTFTLKPYLKFNPIPEPKHFLNGQVTKFIHMVNILSICGLSMIKYDSSQIIIVNMPLVSAFLFL